MFLTLLAAGVSLVFGAGQSAGIVLLGLAFAWILGSNSRIVHWLLVGLGLALLAGPIGLDWRSHRQASKRYESNVAAFEHRIPELAKEYPAADTKLTAEQTETLRAYNTMTETQFAHWLKSRYPELQKYGDHEVAEGVLKRLPKRPSYISLPLPDGRHAHFPVDTTNAVIRAAIAREFPQTPGWYLDALAARVDVAGVPGDEKPGNPPEPFKLWRAVTESWIFEAPGVLLFCVGLGLILGAKPKGSED